MKKEKKIIPHGLNQQRIWNHYIKIVQKNITLVDARKLSDTRYSEHDTFNQQIAIADVIVGNKQDLYTHSDAEALETYVVQRTKPNTPVLLCEKGEFPISVLKGSSSALVQPWQYIFTFFCPSDRLFFRCYIQFELHIMLQWKINRLGPIQVLYWSIQIQNALK